MTNAARALLFSPLFAWTLLAAAPATAASFDCKKAASVNEKLICGDPQLSLLDEKLNASYKTALAGARDKGLIKQWQRDWLKSYLVRDCTTTACLSTSFAARVKLLDQVSAVGVSAPWTGRYVRYYDGRKDTNEAELLLVGLRDNHVYVSGSAMWLGANPELGMVHTGEIDGIGPLRGKRASFKLDECDVEMELRGTDIEVLSESGCGGHNVTFVGSYKRQ